MEKIDFDKLVSQDSLLKELGISKQALSHRYRILKKRGIEITKVSNSEKKVYMYPDDAQKLRGYKTVYPKNRNEVKGSRTGKGGKPTHKKEIK